MNAELFKYLKQDFPEIYVNGNNLLVGDGWFALIYQLSRDIVSICRSEGHKIPHAEEIKQKYGGLRFPIYSVNSEMERIVTAAENGSEFICEVCGAPGQLRNESNSALPMYTVCDLHNPPSLSLDEDTLAVIVAKQLESIGTRDGRGEPAE